MSDKMFCWYCDYFFLDSGVSGQCRRKAPCSIDYQSIPGTAETAGSRVFALIDDASTNFCGDYKPALDSREDPPV